MAKGSNSYTSHLACLVSGLYTLSAIPKTTQRFGKLDPFPSLRERFKQHLVCSVGRNETF